MELESTASGEDGRGKIDPAAAWQELGHRLRGFVAKRLAAEDVDDLVQSVMIRLLERRDEIDAESVRAWLFAVTRNAVAEHYRRKRPMIPLDQFPDLPELDPSDPADRTRTALTDCLDPMMETLSSADAEILRRVDLQGASQLELAQQLGVPPSTVKSRVQRARTKLRAAFDACCTIAISREGAPVEMEPGEACRGVGPDSSSRSCPEPSGSDERE